MDAEGVEGQSSLTWTHRNRDMTGFQKRAQQGDANAQFRLALCCLSGCLDETVEEEFAQLRKIADAGAKDAEVSVRECHDRGLCLKQDVNVAVAWCRKAAEQKHAGGQHILGLCLLNGIGLTKDTEAAIKCYRAAAKQGHGQSQKILRKYSGGASKMRSVCREMTRPLSIGMRKPQKQVILTVTPTSGGAFIMGLVSRRLWS